ncbi:MULTISPECIES: tail fiber assembly protein [Citrobacter freundii complex]|uniref:tail fiber assembly protein n=1 Tax=Citrobacter freundii complex TaxID=1344959 RepID=UPI0022455CD3|nr:MULTISPECIES: tail fiber assembly protein [Citrobacter freundii complex]EKV6292702.1 tail fiber assembly protein [Citrobacter freundii]EKW9106896.1 tail fiber assembly protein [Citrobacter freundii]MCX2446629.1 tail fiber assembly protein [Citrobacter freundii complex sp. 2022EL-00822]MCX2489162.1 tail fiber assembly protein [Citrobacter freundii complex sp. 2022EL-00971]MDF0509620.1 tail fiber assembly protein [Citrobacter freundii]
MKYIYDAKTNAFYPVELKDSYLDKGLWPESGVEIDEETFAEFQAPPPGKVRVAGGDGYPAWATIPPPTHKEQVAMADAHKQSLIDQANEYINSKQWPGKAAMGRLKDTEKEQYNAWLDYLDALEAMDTSIAPDINWPALPNV